MLRRLGQQMLRKIGQQMLTKLDRQLFHTIATDARLAGANQQMFLTNTIAFCHAWPILLFAPGVVVIPLLTGPATWDGPIMSQKISMNDIMASISILL